MTVQPLSLTDIYAIGDYTAHIIAALPEITHTGRRIGQDYGLCVLAELAAQSEQKLDLTSSRAVWEAISGLNTIPEHDGLNNVVIEDLRRIKSKILDGQYQDALTTMRVIARRDLPKKEATLLRARELVRIIQQIVERQRQKDKDLDWSYIDLDTEIHQLVMETLSYKDQQGPDLKFTTHLSTHSDGSTWVLDIKMLSPLGKDVNWDSISSEQELLGKAVEYLDYKDTKKWFIQGRSDPFRWGWGAIDQSLSTIIPKLWMMGAKTRYCCGGHPYGLYIVFEGVNQDFGKMIPALEKTSLCCTRVGCEYDWRMDSLFRTVNAETRDEALRVLAEQLNIYCPDEAFSEHTLLSDRICYFQNGVLRGETSR